MRGTRSGAAWQGNRAAFANLAIPPTVALPNRGGCCVSFSRTTCLNAPFQLRCSNKPGADLNHRAHDNGPTHEVRRYKQPCSHLPQCWRTMTDSRTNLPTLSFAPNYRSCRQWTRYVLPRCITIVLPVKAIDLHEKSFDTAVYGVRPRTIRNASLTRTLQAAPMLRMLHLGESIHIKSRDLLFPARPNGIVP